MAYSATSAEAEAIKVPGVISVFGNSAVRVDDPQPIQRGED
jgi:hypothetical protein